MTTNIQLLRSSIAFKRPSAAPLLDGQAAINLNASEPGLFWRLTNGQLAKAGPVAVTDNGMQPNAAPAGETGNSLGEEWLDAQPALHAPILHVFNGTEFVTANGFTVDKSTGDLTLLRTLEVTKFVTGEGQVNGNLIVGGNITPDGQNCAFYLGLPNERWDFLYSCNLDTSFDGKIGRDLTVENNATIKNNLAVVESVASNLIPDIDSTRNLGSATKRWNAWLSSLDIDGSMELGKSCADTLTVNATTTFKCPVTFENDVFFPNGIKDLELFGDIVLGDGCNTSTINLNGEVTLSCDMLVKAHNTQSIGTAAARVKNLFVQTTQTDTLTVDGKGTSASTTSGDNAKTLTTKDYVLSEIESQIQNQKGDITVGDGCNTSTVNLNGAVTLSCDMVPSSNSARTIGSDAKKLKALYADDVYTGDLHLKNEKGDWTMIEAEDYLTIRNNNTGKTFRLLMEEV